MTTEEDEALLSFGDCLQPGRYRLHSRFDRALNYLKGSSLASLVTPEVGGGPLNVVLTDLRWINSRGLIISPGGLKIGGHYLPFTENKKYRSEPAYGAAATPPQVMGLLSRFKEILLELAPPLSFAFLLETSRSNQLDSAFDRQLVHLATEAWNCFQRLEVSSGAGLILGLGYGLTPSGDDFIAGWAAGLHLLAHLCRLDVANELQLITAQIVRANPISFNLLHCALRGKYGEKFRNLLQAFGNGCLRDVEHLTAQVLGIGATSGADFSTGLAGCLQIHLSANARG